MLKTDKIIYLLILTCTTSFALFAADEKISSQKMNKESIVIETKVTGSQEQPKVLYIMPWQGVKKPIEIKGNKRVLVMPKFQPINPKKFKKQVSSYYKQSG